MPRIAVAALLVLGSYKELSQARPFAEYRQKVPNIVYDDYRTNLRTIAAGGGRYLSDAVPANSTQRTEIVLPDGLSGIPALYYYVAVQPRLYARPNNQLGALADSVQGRDGGLVPTARWRDFYVNATGTIGNINAGQNIALPSQLHWDSLDLLAVEWFVAGDDLAASERAVLASHGFTVVGKDGYVELWRRVAPPLARLFHDVDVVASAQERVAKFSAGYPLLERAMVEESVQVKPQGTAGEYVQMGPPGRTTVRLTATVSSDALLVLADPYYPGWQATVDGRRVPILPVDSTFRGVRLTPGVHRVEFRYVDTPFRRGAALSLLTVIGLAGWTLIRRRRTSATR